MLFRLITVSIILLTCALHATSGHDGESSRAASRPATSVTITIGQPLTLPVCSTRPTPSARVDEPHELRVVFPNGRTVLSVSRYTSVVADKSGRAEYVTLLPLLDAVPLPEAAATLMRFCQSNGIEPDEMMRNEIASWPKEHIDTRRAHQLPFCTGTGIGERAELFATIRPDSSSGNWYVVIDLSASGIYDPPRPATTKSVR